MTLPMGISARYEFVPDSLEHRPGDIWVDLPCIRALWTPCSMAVVITPACDLKNCKSESITVLPLVPLKKVLGGIPFVRVFRSNLNEVLKRHALPAASDDEQKTNLPSAAELQQLRTAIELARDCRVVAADLARLVAGEQLLTGLRTGDLTVDQRFDLAKVLLGKANFRKLASSIIENEELPYHYFPADDQSAELTAISEPMVALLRFPVSFPVSILDLAGHVAAADWPAHVGDLAAFEPIASDFVAKRPVKVAQLKSRFCADLLTRFVSVFVRLGAPELPSGHTETTLVTKLGLS